MALACSCRNGPFNSEINKTLVSTGFGRKRSLTNILVENGYKDINGSLDSKQPQAENDQELEDDVVPWPHVGNQETDFPPEAVPGGRVVFCSAQKALRYTEHRVA